MVTQIWVNTGWGNGLLPDGTQALPEPMLTHPYSSVGGGINRRYLTHQAMIYMHKNYYWSKFSFTLRWRHNGCDSVSNHLPHQCLLNRLFRHRSEKTSKLRVTGLCAGNSPGTGEFPAQMASYVENVSIWWRHHESPRGQWVNDLLKQWFRATAGLALVPFIWNMPLKWLTQLTHWALRDVEVI